MLRGAFILALGYTLGYGHAVARTPEIREVFQAVKKAWDEAETTNDKPGVEYHDEPKRTGENPA